MSVYFYWTEKKNECNTDNNNSAFNERNILKYYKYV